MQKHLQAAGEFPSSAMTSRLDSLEICPLHDFISKNQ